MAFKRSTAPYMNKVFRLPFFIRLAHWEYWNSTFVYAPLYPYWLWLSIKARSIYFLTAANPSIKNGGYIMESKMDVYGLLPKQAYPLTLLFDPATKMSEVLQRIADAGITYPFIAKPDIGERGLGVKKIETEADLQGYVDHMPVAFLVQEYVHYEKEVGIFYYKPPGAVKGYISGIVYKEPVTIVGDGISTFEMLVKRNDRYLLQWKQIKAMYPDKIGEVVARGKSLVLVPYGNHSRGSKFTDVTSMITPALTQTIDNICGQIPEFYYGRLDVRFDNWDTLENGADYSIIEVNGSGSEPTHIYDPGHSILFAWREIIKHWKLLYNISNYNNKRGTPYITLAQGRQEMRSFKVIESLLSVRNW
jgi:hypothetical protein